MKVLIIDDSDYKIQGLQTLLKECGFVSNVQIARCFQSGVKQLREFGPDLVLLDMSLPTSEGKTGELEGRNRIYGGRELLGEMEFYDIASKVVIVTQFDHFGEPPNEVKLETLLRQLQGTYPQLMLGGVYYSDIDQLWRPQLKAILQSLRDGKDENTPC
jgi:hypothetical protein